MHAVDVAIHGRGAVASSLALALNQQGLRVAVSTPDPANAARTDVRAYALNSASRRLLQQLKVWEALPADAVTAVHDMDVRGDSGAHLGFSSWGQCVDALAWIVDAAALDAALQQALQFAPLVQRFEVMPDAPLRVFAEGKDSVSRASLPVRWERHAYGHTAIAARLASQEPARQRGTPVVPCARRACLAAVRPTGRRTVVRIGVVAAAARSRTADATRLRGVRRRAEPRCRRRADAACN